MKKSRVSVYFLIQFFVPGILFSITINKRVRTLPGRMVDIIKMMPKNAVAFSIVRVEERYIIHDKVRYTGPISQRCELPGLVYRTGRVIRIGRRTIAKIKNKKMREQLARFKNGRFVIYSLREGWVYDFDPAKDVRFPPRRKLKD